jgi:hypothetical protein
MMLSTAIPSEILMAGEDMMSIGIFKIPKLPKIIAHIEIIEIATTKTNLIEVEIIKIISKKTAIKDATPLIMLDFTEAPRRACR